MLSKFFKKKEGRMPPCKKHKLALPNMDYPEVKGMQKHGVKFTYCKLCGWVIVKS